jgi:hypothetical protein
MHVQFWRGNFACNFEIFHIIENLTSPRRGRVGVIAVIGLQHIFCSYYLSHSGVCRPLLYNQRHSENARHELA